MKAKKRKFIMWGRFKEQKKRNKVHIHRNLVVEAIDFGDFWKQWTGGLWRTCIRREPVDPGDYILDDGYRIGVMDEVMRENQT